MPAHEYPKALGSDIFAFLIESQPKRIILQNRPNHVMDSCAGIYALGTICFGLKRFPLRRNGYFNIKVAF